MPQTDETSDVLVIGAGPGGLATSQQLAARGIAHRVLERGDVVGYTWAHLYDSLTLHTGKRLSNLPGRRFPRHYATFVPRPDFWEYLRGYAESFGLPVRLQSPVTRLVREGNVWRATTPGGGLRARAVVVATGIVTNPLMPQIPGRERFGGNMLHSVEYRRPGPFVGRRVLVVGVGNSGAEIGSELARAGAHVTLAVRSGANVVPKTLFGVPIQYLAYWVRKLPRPAQVAIVGAIGQITVLRRGPPVLPRPGHSPLDAIPVIGFHLVDAIKAGLVAVRPGVAEFTPEGARFTDGTTAAFDDVILATGFAPALAPLTGLVQTDRKGFARRIDRVTSADQPQLYFVGHNYDATGGLYNINVDSQLAAARIAATLS
jgi:cation diffusion facilitator CzcD-associated flavoprotein CzcO